MVNPAPNAPPRLLRTRRASVAQIHIHERSGAGSDAEKLETAEKNLESAVGAPNSNKVRRKQDALARGMSEIAQSMKSKDEPRKLLAETKGLQTGAFQQW